MTDKTTNSGGVAPIVAPSEPIDIKWRAERTLEHLRSLVEEANEWARDASKSFYQAITATAAGAIALSLTFVEKIAPKQPRIRSELLVWSWVCFGVSLVLIAIAFRQFASERERAEQRMNDWVYKVCFGKMTGKDSEEALGADEPFVPKPWPTRIAYAAVASLSLGLAVLIWFSALNLK